MRMKKLWLGCAAAIFVALSAQGAAAACVQYGKVVRFYTAVAGSNDFSYVYILPRTSSIVTYGYYFRINADESSSLSAIAAASASRQTVRLAGSASSCPTTGTWRYGGVLLSINVYAQF